MKTEKTVHVLHIENDPDDVRYIADNLKGPYGHFELEVAGTLSEGLDSIFRLCFNVISADVLARLNHARPNSADDEDIKKQFLSAVQNCLIQGPVFDKLDEFDQDDRDRLDNLFNESRKKKCC
ncbi:MAG: hypothetical protein GY874_21675 [Desulfobacteraceae bacterium]|nr:hypothetical protein [Desulfobacteraceae bacterium]